MRQIRLVGMTMVALLLAFLVLEGGVRAVRWGSELAGYPLFHYEHHYLYQGHPYNRWALRPSVRFQYRHKVIHVNSLGFRGPEITREKPPGVVRILALGGSSVFGAGLTADEQAWPARLQQVLNERSPDCRVEVVNGGVPGASTADALTRLAFVGDEIAADVAILYESFNDSLNNVPAPGKTFRRDYSHRYTSYDPPLWSRSVLLSFVSNRLKRLPFSRKHLAHEYNQEGVEVYRRNAGLFCAVARELGIVPVLANQAHDLASLDRPLQNHGVGLTQKILEAHARALRQVAERTGAPFVDVHGALAREEAGGLFLDEIHLSEAGSLRAAEVLADALEPVVAERCAAPADPDSHGQS